MFKKFLKMIPEVVEIGKEIVQNLAFLETELVDVPQRQKSLRSVFHHSWQLLSESEREVMRALSVFRGGFTREAAQAIAGDGRAGDLLPGGVVVL